MTEDERLIGQLLRPPFWSSKLRPPGQLIGTKDQCLPPPTTSAVPTEPLSSPPKRTILVFCPSGTHALWYPLVNLITKLKLEQLILCYPRSRCLDHSAMPDLQAKQSLRSVNHPASKPPQTTSVGGVVARREVVCPYLAEKKSCKRKEKMRNLLEG